MSYNHEESFGLNQEDEDGELLDEEEENYDEVGAEDGEDELTEGDEAAEEGA